MEADTFPHGDVSKAHSAAGMVHGAPVRSQPRHRWRVLPFFSMLCSWWHFCFLSQFSKRCCTIIHPPLQMRSFECLFLPHNLSTDSLFCALYFDQFLHIWGQLFWKLCFWMLALLATWCARPCALDRLCWFFYLIKYLIMSSQIRRAALLSVCLRPQTKRKRQFDFISKHRKGQSNRN